MALFVNTTGSRALPRIEIAMMAVHVALFFALLVVLVVMSPTKQTAETVFTSFQNNSGWDSDVVAWCVGLLSSCYALVGYDSVTHMSEEMDNPAVGVPTAMVGSVVINGLTGFAFLLTILFCTQDFEAALASPTRYPIMEIFRQATRGSLVGGTVMSAFIALMATHATIPLMAAASRMVWAFARDKGLPFSSALSRVPTSRFHQVPVTALLAVTGLLIVLGLLNIASTTAFNAILSMSVVGLYISYLMPVLLLLHRRCTRPKEIQWGPWRLNNKVGIVLNIVASVYTMFTCVFMLFPPYQPVTAQNMNYAAPVITAMLLLSAGYWGLEGRKSYVGPLIAIVGLHARDI